MIPSKLAEIQYAVRAVIRSSVSSESISGSLDQVIVDQPPLTRSQRVSIYSDAWFYRLRESLREDYEALAYCMGLELFSQLVRDYLCSFPSRKHSLFYTGENFPRFVKAWTHPKKEIWYDDLAELEQSVYLSFSSANSESWSFQKEMENAPDQIAAISLQLESGVFLCCSKWSVDEVWRKSLQGIRSFPKEVSTPYLVSRQGFEVRVKKITQKKFHLLKMIETGKTLGEVLDQFPTEKTVSWISEWASSGIVRPSFNSRL